MRRRVGRLTAALSVLALLLAACGNSGDDEEEATPTTASTSETTGADGGDDGGDAGGGDRRDEFVALEGVPGVTDDEIAYAVIGTRSNNPLGTCILDCYLDGIKAYFAFRNAEGGIYGRDLVVSHELDDELAQNQVRALEVIESDDVFGSFNATLSASGWGDLDDAGVPTYTWGIHATEAAGREAVFPSIGVVCGDCTGKDIPFAMTEVGAKKGASLGYGVTENSRVCAQSVARSIERYQDDAGIEVAYLNDNLDFGLPNGIGPEVTAMKSAGVDFISTCLDLNGMKTLATELDRQGMQDVVLYHPNTYNQAFVREAGDLFEGDIVTVQFRPFEADPGDSALADFLEWMDETGAELSELAMVGWINADLAFEGLLAAGPEFDRASVLEATNAMTEYSAGGLIVPIDGTRQHEPPAQDDPNGHDCAALVRVKNGAFETVAPPDKPWLCWESGPEWSEPVPTDFS
jgi:ABC-type branched-subunit amino acid transport system substrate-binding protein